ncbi:MAG: tetratricopeptide repeat protein [Acidimicrobiales bacterium]
MRGASAAPAVAGGQPARAPIEVAAAPDAELLAELEDEKAFLLRSLDDLDDEREAGDIAEADYEQLRGSYTARAAEVIRELEAMSGAPLAARPGPVRQRAEPPLGPPTRRGGVLRAVGSRAFRRVVAAALAVSFAAAAGVLVARYSGNRLPGQTATGGITLNIATRMAQAEALVSKGDPLGAIKDYQAILARHPNQPQPLAYEGWVLHLVAMQSRNPTLSAQAASLVQRAVSIDPHYADARFFYGMILIYEHRPAAAVPQLQAFLADNPPSQLVAQVKALLAKTELQVTSAHQAAKAARTG